MKRSMKRIWGLSIALTGVCLFSTGNTFAQSVEVEEEKTSAVHISFVPPLSTNWQDAANYTNHFSLNMLVGISKNETAFTLGGLANIIGNNANGVQFAGLYNYVGNDGTGILFSGLVNMVMNNYSGLQGAGLLNAAKEIKGGQLAGLVNVAEDVDGFQFAGLINAAKNVKGVQFAGLINIAETSDYPIGFLNLIKEGERGIAVTYNEIGSSIISFRSGGKNTYGILGIGFNDKVKSNSYVTTGGFGAHINIAKWLRINNELSGETIGTFSKNTTYKAGYALLPAFKIGQHFELFGGASINYMYSNDMSNRNLFTNNPLWKNNTSLSLQQVHIGYQIGLQYMF